MEEQRRADPMNEVYVLIRTDVENRGRGVVMSRDVRGIFADPFMAKQEIPEWAVKERRMLTNKEVYAAGYSNVEFVVEEWAVQG